MLYFAYGSNLSTFRLLQRVPSAKLITPGQLTQHRLYFHKIGRDGSAKCDAYFTGRGSDVLYGALYKIDPAQKKHLDSAEGLGNGYEIKDVTIHTEDSQVKQAFTYYATRIAKHIKPFHWYKQHVLAGATEHCFPQDYIKKIAAIDAVEDGNLRRVAQELNIYPIDHQHCG